MYKMLYTSIGSLIFSIIVAVFTNTFDIFSIIGVFLVAATYLAIFIYLEYLKNKIENEKKSKDVFYYWNIIKQSLSNFIGQEELIWNKGKDNQIESRYYKIKGELVLFYAFICYTYSRSRVIIIINTKEETIARIDATDSAILVSDPFKNFKIEDGYSMPNIYNPKNNHRIIHKINEDRATPNYNAELIDRIKDEYNS